MILSVVGLVSAVLLHTATGQPGQQCLNKNQTTGLCPTSYGGFHVICTETNPDAAVSACAALGMRLALLTDSNSQQALYTLQECLSTPGLTAGWVGGWNGAGADPCAFLSADGGVLMSFGYSGCYGGLQLVAVCQELPVATAIVTDYQYTEVTTGTSTSTVSICTRCDGFKQQHEHKSNIDDVKNTNNNSNNSNSNDEKAAEGKPRRHECDRRKPESCRRPPPLCPFGPCTPVCPFTVCGLHVVQADNLSYSQAQEECAKYGWNLADLTAAQHEDVAFLQGYCSRQEASNAYWIRSYNGVDGAKCVRALGANENDNNNVPIVFGIEDYNCADLTPQKPWALCQDAPPAVTGTGLYNGILSFVTTVTVAKPVTMTQPVTTTTTTNTHYFTVPCDPK